MRQYSEKTGTAICKAMNRISSWCKRNQLSPLSTDQRECVLDLSRQREALDMLHDLRDRVGVPSLLVAECMVAMGRGK